VVVILIPSKEVGMDVRAPRDLIVCLQQLPDPRRHNARHMLTDIVAIAILAVLCGADSAVEIEWFGKSKRKWLASFLALPHGIPSHDTFGRVLAALDPEAFERCLMQWTQTLSVRLSGQVRHVAADGKTLRGSIDHANRASGIDMVSVWCSEQGLVWGQLGAAG